MDELLPYYDRELTYIRELGKEFALKYPKIASRLQLSEGLSQDPHVERLIESFAYVAARIRHKIDDDFPEITDAMLGVLYPHFQRPIPSMGIVQFHLARDQFELTSGYSIGASKDAPSYLDTESFSPFHDVFERESCRFKTCYPVQLWPIVVANAALSSRPGSVPNSMRSRDATAVLSLDLETYSGQVGFGMLELDQLRFYLHAGQKQNVYELYELLLSHTLEVVVCETGAKTASFVMSSKEVCAVGFEPNEAVIPYSARSFPGYRLLTEYFSIPEKFLFIDLVGLRQRLKGLGHKVSFHFLLTKTSAPLERDVSKDVFRLGCTPVINTFPQRLDSFHLEPTESEHMLIADHRRPRALEIYSIEKVTGIFEDGSARDFDEFYGIRHASESNQKVYWHAARRVSTVSEEDDYPGVDTFLSLLDLNFDPSAPEQATIHVEAICTNRQLPAKLPSGIQLFLTENQGPVERIEFIKSPTRPMHPALRNRARWQLISHLSLNHLSLFGEEGLASLKEILRLYNPSRDSAADKQIDGIVDLRTRRVVGRAGAICKGLEVELQLDEDKYPGSGVFLFGSVLERFLGLYTSINSFTRLVMQTRQRQGKTEAIRWPARAGNRDTL